MGLAFKSAGVVDLTSFTPDADPNISEPTADRVFEIPDRTDHGAQSFGVRFYVKYTNPTGSPQVTIVPWVKDETTGNWAKAVAESGIEDGDALVSPDLAPGRCFFQVTAFSGTADAVEIFAAAA